MSYSLKKVYGFSDKDDARVKKVTGKSLSNLLMREALILEQETLAQQVQAAGAKPVTLVVLYGPPAAGKGAAKKDIGTFIGGVEQNFEDWLDDIGDEGNKHFQEEDAAG